MPELPEVETVRATLEPVLTGRTITHIDITLPRLIKNATVEAFSKALSGCTFTAVGRKGKYLRLCTDGSSDLLVHLRMTGSLIYDAAGNNRPKTAHIVFHLDKGLLYYCDVRTFGCLWLAKPGEKTGISGYDELGPDANSSAVTADYLREKMKASSRTVKSFLLDQTVLAGLGNIYVDEALFLAGIRPSRRCNHIGKERTQRLAKAIHTVLAEGIEYGGTTIRDFVNGSGREGENQENLVVYGREGTPCKTCGTLIKYVKQGGRGTHYCPHCQH